MFYFLSCVIFYSYGLLSRRGQILLTICILFVTTLLTCRASVT